MEKLINSDEYLIFDVRDHKRKSGKPAPEALTQTAYKVLMKHNIRSTKNSPRRKFLCVYDFDNTQQIPPVISRIRLLTELGQQLKTMFTEQQDLGFSGHLE